MAFTVPFPTTAIPITPYSHSHGIPVEMGLPWAFRLPRTPLHSITVCLHTATTSPVVHWIQNVQIRPDPDLD